MISKEFPSQADAMNEWLKVMLEEVRRKQAERIAERIEHERREEAAIKADDDWRMPARDRDL
jgi:hypothetical protein